MVMKMKLALQDQRIFKIEGLSITWDYKHSSECGRKFDSWCDQDEELLYL